MNTILLEPTDVLFFRDGRPMGGASSGHGAAWPLPNVINHAFHAALHRAGFVGVHEHRRGQSGSYEATRDRKFGSLVTAGPFPVCTNGSDHTWFFPRPADSDDSGKAVLLPAKTTGASSLPSPLLYPVASSKPPSKKNPKSWWSEGAWNAYLGTGQRNGLAGRPFRKNDSDFSDTEHAYGIGLSAETGTVEEGAFYAAHYLRLREGWKIGVFASAVDKDFRHDQYGNDLVRTLLNGHGTEIIAGGQQRVCTATLDGRPYERRPLPLGKTSGFKESNGRWPVKWVLLTPAIFPAIGDHRGGWLPNWIAPTTGAIQLLDGPGANAARRRNVPAGKSINAHLVAAITGKPIPVTGWALPNEADPGRSQGGAKSTHLAVPAGAVYYFEAASETDARNLAAALNWHGADTDSALPIRHSAIKNRRSTLMGEKGFGLGVCGSWDFQTAPLTTDH